MRKKSFIFFVIFLTVLALNGASAADSNDIKKLVELPEKEIDVGIAALTLAKEIYPNLNIRAYSKKIDDMAAGAKLLTKWKTAPDYRIKALNTYLYKVEGIQYDFSDPYAKKLENRYLNGILDTKKGSCVTMPLLYLAIAQRLGYPVYAVAAPQHLFLRYVDPRIKLNNIEATGGGGYSRDEKYKEDFQISEKAIKNGVYLSTMTNRELLADLIAQNGIYWGQKGDVRRAIEYLEAAVGLNPKGAEIYENLGKAYLTMYKKVRGPVSEWDYFMKAEAAFKKAEDLGIVRLSAENNTAYYKYIEKKNAEQ